MLELWMKARPLPRAQTVISYPVHGRSTAGIRLLHLRESLLPQMTEFHPFCEGFISFHAHCMSYVHLHAPGLVTTGSL